MNNRFINFGAKRVGSIVAALFMALSLSSSLPAHAADGQWVDKQYSIKGGWSIEKRDGQTVISFNDSFSTKNGPDLKLFLSKKSIDDATGKNAAKDSVLIGKLQKNKGKQEYVLPADINVDDYKSLLIHCEAFSVLWGGGAL